MKINYKTLSLMLRGTLSSIVIVSLFIISQRYWLNWLPHLMSFSIIVAILSTTLLIKTDRLKNAIWAGIGFGILTGILFFSYHFVVDYLDESVVDTAGNTPEVVLGFITIFSIFFTIIWILSCITGATISYFIRKRIG